MTGLILQALAYGLFLALLVGPIFITLVNAGMQKGVRAAMQIALGIWVSDILLVALLIYLSKTFSIKISNQVTTVLGVISGSVFIVMGIGIWLKRNQLTSEKIIDNKKLISLFTYGFVLNVINPFAIIFWIGLVTNHILINKLPILESVIFFGIIILCIIISDALKVLLSKTVKKYLSEKNIVLFKAICGLLLIVSGISIVARVMWG